MQFAYEKVQGLDRDRVVAVIEPVLRAHGVAGVELVWRTERKGPVLAITVEDPEAKKPGQGITLDICAEISRDLSAALDVEDVIPAAYRLEVGSPGVERALYRADDYRKFAGQIAKLKLTEAIEGELVLRGKLEGVDDDSVKIACDQGALSVPLAQIRSARLVFDWGQQQRGPASGRANRRKPRKGRA